MVSQGLFALSAAAYAVYWVLQEPALGPAGLCVLLLSVVFGAVGAAGALMSVIDAGPDTSPRSRFGLRHIVGAGGALLILTYVLTTVAMGRMFTLGLVFAIVWATLELCALHEAHRRGWIPGGKAFAAITVVILALAFGLVCYAVYYLLEGRARFYAGVVPYGVAALAMLLVAVLLRPEKASSSPPRSS
jgi:hypothetical protein